MGREQNVQNGQLRKIQLSKGGFGAGAGGTKAEQGRKKTLMLKVCATPPLTHTFSVVDEQRRDGSL